MTFVRSVALLKICSFARGVRNDANEFTTGTIPLSASPPAWETMSCSAIPHSTNRSGNRSRNGMSPQSRYRSASRTTRRSSRAATSASAAP
jgi:hypothetical protein